MHHLHAVSKRTPVNIIGGFLGVGKTTAINHLLAHKPADEQWAVLVNEYGEVGIDAALLAERELAEGVTIKELAGGCICCSAGIMFQISLTMLLQELRPDRLLIEPTGLATLSGVIDTLSKPGIREGVELRTVISLVDPERWVHFRDNEPAVWGDQISAADVLLANRVDLASVEALELFEAEVAQLFPPKRLVARIHDGEVDPALLDLVTDIDSTRLGAGHDRPPRAHAHHDHADHDHEHAHHDHEHAHEHAHEHEHAVEDDAAACDAPVGPREIVPGVRRFTQHGDEADTFGWVLGRELVLEVGAAQAWLENLAGRAGFLRLKGIVHTSVGWHAHNITPGSRGPQHMRAPASYRRDSRVEVIFERGSAAIEELEAGLLAALTR